MLARTLSAPRSNAMIASAGELYTPDSGLSLAAATYSPVSPSIRVVRKYRPVTMSRRGMASGRPDAGDRMLFDDSIRMRASACASARQRQVHGHLVTVEVGVERLTHQRVQLNCLALHQLRLEGLDAEAVQRRCAVQQHRVLADDLFEDIPHLRDADARPSAWRS